MAPIRKGDGTPLEIPGVSEVRSGDGRVFFDAIPDSEDFEHNDLTGNYGGDTDSFAIQSENVDEGSFALEIQATDFAWITRSTEQAWDRDGLRISWRQNSSDTQTGGGLAVATSVTGADDVDGYAFLFNPSGGTTRRLRRYDNGSDTSLDDSAASATSGAWVDCSVEFDGESIVYQSDGETLTANDNTYTQLYLAFHGFDTDTFIDGVTFEEID